jgi:hypothetical protein
MYVHNMHAHTQAAKPLMTELLKHHETLLHVLIQLMSSSTDSLQNIGLNICELLLCESADIHEVLVDCAVLWSIAAIAAHRENEFETRSRGLSLLVSLARQHDAAAVYLRNAHVKIFSRLLDGQNPEAAAPTEKTAQSMNKLQELAQARAKPSKDAKKASKDSTQT